MVPYVATAINTSPIKRAASLGVDEEALNAIKNKIAALITTGVTKEERMAIIKANLDEVRRQSVEAECGLQSYLGQVSDE